MSTTTTSTTGTQTIYGIGSGLSSATSTSSSSAATVASSLNANDFMTLFLTQLQNQDPTNPMESYELAAQLAQFTTVQELQQATTQLGNIQQYTAAVNNAQMATLVGKQVLAQMNTINVSSGTPTQLSYTLPSAATVTVTIQDSNGNTVYNTNLSQSAGTYSVPWNGKDLSGNTVADGTYTCTVTAAGSSGTSITIQPYVQGQVYSCDLNGSPPTYTLSGANGMQVPVSSVYEVTSSN